MEFEKIKSTESLVISLYRVVLAQSDEEVDAIG
jgi:hypothetical protein